MEPDSLGFAGLAVRSAYITAEQHLPSRLPELRSQVILVEDARKALAHHLDKGRVHDAVVHVCQSQAGRAAGRIAWTRARVFLRAYGGAPARNAILLQSGSPLLFWRGMPRQQRLAAMVIIAPQHHANSCVRWALGCAVRCLRKHSQHPNQPATVLHGST